MADELDPDDEISLSVRKARVALRLVEQPAETMDQDSAVVERARPDQVASLPAQDDAAALDESLHGHLGLQPGQLGVGDASHAHLPRFLVVQILQTFHVTIA
jgi:hypothetical protein